MKRILVTALSVLLIATMAIGGSVAYLTSTDNATNTFSMGDVEIKQYEKTRNGSNFVNDQLLLPSSSFSKDDTEIDTNEDTNLWTANNGEIDKIVTVENTGKTPAYVRTIFAFENTGDIDTGKFIIKNYNTDETVGVWKSITDATTGEQANFYYLGETYNLYSFTYKAALAAGATSQPSLRQVAMAAEADNDVVDAIANSYDKKYTILVASQAVQAINMKKTEDGELTDMTAEEALNAAFDEITATNHPWMKPADSQGVGSLAQVRTSLFDGDDYVGGTIHLTEDLVVEMPKATEDTVVNLDGRTIVQTPERVDNWGISGGSYIVADADLTMENGKFEMAHAHSYIDVRPKTAGSTTTQTFENMVFQNDNMTTTRSPANCVTAAVKVWHEAANCKTILHFKNCTFNNTSIEIAGSSDRATKFELILENCTFNAVTSGSLINIKSNAEGTIKMSNCSFNLKATADYASIIDVMSKLPVTIEYGTGTKANNALNVRMAKYGDHGDDFLSIAYPFDISNVKFEKRAADANVTVQNSAFEPRVNTNPSF